MVKSYQVCDSQDFLSVKYEPYNVPTSKDIKIGAGVELVLTGMLPPCSKTYAQCFIYFSFLSFHYFCFVTDVSHFLNFGGPNPIIRRVLSSKNYQYVVMELADKLYNSVTACFSVSP